MALDAQPDVLMVEDTGNGVYRTRDEGLTWEMAMLLRGDALIVYEHAGLMILLWWEMVIQSTDGGVSWSIRNRKTPFDSGFSAAQHAGTLLVAARDSIWRSTDDGLTWTATTASGDYRISLLHVGGSVWLYTGPATAANTSAIGRSTDDGQTWGGGMFSPTDRIEVAGDSSALIAVGPGSFTFAPFYPPIVYRSTDAGATWMVIDPVTDPLYESGVDYGGGVFLLTASGTGTLSTRGVWRSTDGGVTWVARGDDHYNGYGMTRWYIDGVWYGWHLTSGGGGVASTGQLRYSTDGGLTWPVLFNPGTGTQEGIDFANFVRMFGAAGRLYGATDQGVTYQSTDGGITWNGTLSGGGGFITVDGNHWMVPGRYGLFHSDDNGDTWYMQYLPGQKAEDFPNAGASRGGTTLMLYSGYSERRQMLYRSTDHQTWAQIPIPLDQPYGNFTPFMLEHGDGRWAITDSSAISYSDDDGLTWSSPELTFFTDADGEEQSADPDMLVSGGKTWITSSRNWWSSESGYRAMYSTSGGTSWALTDPPVLFDSSDVKGAAGDGQFVVADDTTVWRSKDGRSWTSQIPPTTYDYLLAYSVVHYHGVWLIFAYYDILRSVDGGNTWTAIDKYGSGLADLIYAPNLGGLIGGYNYLRMTQRDDIIGVQRAPRLTGTGINNPTSAVLGKPQRLAQSNTYL